MAQKSYLFHLNDQGYSYWSAHMGNGACLVAQRVKHLPAMRETWVQSLGGEDPLEKEMATHSSILAWGTSWTEEPGGLQSIGHKELDMTESMHPHPKGE